MASFLPAPQPSRRGHPSLGSSRRPAPVLPWRWRRRLLALLLPLCLGPATALAAESTAQPSGIGQIVKALCLSAIETELSKLGKVPPAGMAAYACSCVERQITAGRGIEAARSHCRQLTAQRFPI